MRQVGKIYPAGCSGTVIGVNLVLTAAHCLYHQATCAEYTGNKFLPGMSATNVADASNVSAPWGIWTVSRWWIPDGFRCQFGRYRYLDWAIMEIAPNGGRQIGNVTGWFEAWWNRPGARLYITGYPASGFWATAQGLFGRSQYICDVDFDGRWEDVDETTGVAWAYVVPCPMNGGVSGGPWFVYLNDLKRWVIGGVSGWCRQDPCTPVSTVLISRYLDDNFRQFWESVKPQL